MGRNGDHAPNTVLRAARLARSMSQDELAQALRDAGWQGCDRRTVQRYESGEIRRPQYAARRALVEVLGVPWEQLGFGAPPGQPGGRVDVAADSATEGDDDVRRRTFALGVAMAGLTSTSATTETAEQLRHELLLNGPASALVEEWEAIRDEYAIKVLRLPPAIVLGSLLADLGHLNRALAITKDDASSAELSRIGAYLTGTTAWVFGNLDDHLQAARWFRTSHQLALRSTDRDTQLWVAAQEAVMALYQAGAPLDLTRRKIADFRPLASALPASASVAWLYCADAQAAGMDGDATNADRAFQRLREVFAGLPAAVSGSRDSFLGWPEARLDYTESFTYAHLGNYAAASDAQDRALAALPAVVVRDPVKLELQRALCLAKAGASADAERHALTQLALLDQPQHDLPIANLTARVVAALPADRDTEETGQLRSYTGESGAGGVGRR